VRSAVDAMRERPRLEAMMRRGYVWAAYTTATIAALTATGAAPARGEEPAAESLEREIEELRRQNEQMLERIESLEEEVREEEPAPQPAPAATPIYSKPLGRGSLQLLDLSLDLLTAVGGSTATDDDLLLLQGGEHDPRQRGFTLQQVELGFKGAVDPYMTGEAYLVFFIDPEGESRFELEEAFLTTIALPFGLDDLGFQLEAGLMFTEFGRLNPKHPHVWDWQDQAFVLTRFFGGDGIRSPGARLGWLLPLPWYSELHLGMQNSKGETMVSFLANDEVFAERPIGGRPFTDRSVRSLADFTYLIRWANGFDVSDTASGQLGASLLLGPNATGSSGRTQLVGGDLVVKWSPLRAERGWPFVRFETEFLYRRYEAEDFLGCPEAEVEGCMPAPLPGETLEDWGLYTQLVWGFRRRWSTGLRYEYGDGKGPNVAFDATSNRWTAVPLADDPFRGRRHRVSPLLMFQPSEFSRLRLQYNYDNGTFLEQDDAHTVWLGVEILFGAHPAHAY
jgi:hypothetical protein